MRIQSILILGGGSAGFLTALTLRKANPNLPVTVVRSKELGVIGVGEATTLALPDHLHRYLGLPLKEFYEKANPAWKTGIKFLWGSRPYFFYSFARQFDVRYAMLPKQFGFYVQDDIDYAGLQTALITHGKAFARNQQGLPQISNDIGYHLENVTFVAYLETLAESFGVTVLDDKVIETIMDERGVRALRLASGPTLSADLFVDCSGFASVLLGKALNEPFVSYQSSLYNDRAVTGGWQRQPGEPINPYTTAETMDAGWCWQIDHEHLINRGYVYSSAFISDDDAEKEFRAKNPRVTDTRKVFFRTGRYQRGWVKNVVGVGNSCGFVEPLESTGLAGICRESNHLAEILAEHNGDVTQTLIDAYNLGHAQLWDGIRGFLAIHFKFNTRLDNPYWRACREHADLSTAGPLVDYYRENGPSTLMQKYILPPDAQFDMEGYLALLIGQRAPCNHKFTPTPAESDVVARIRAAWKRHGESGLTAEETLRILRHPQYQWGNIYGAPPPQRSMAPARP